MISATGRAATFKLSDFKRYTEPLLASVSLCAKPLSRLFLEIR
jgi:hypothetical protein